MTKFGFTVKRADFEDAHDSTRAGWRVTLPHSCDQWVIAGEEYIDGLSHADAVARLAAFIGEANLAMLALVERREIDEPRET